MNKAGFAVMRVAVGANHSGYLIREMILDLVAKLGHEPVDTGVHDGKPVDYPEIAEIVANMLRDSKVDRGILIGGTGLGMCIAANKVVGVRAVPCHDAMTAEFSRLHADSNVLCLSAGLLGHRLIHNIVETWLKTPFEGGRHQIRLDKIAKLERGELEC
jgi:ribose 5-phosphate isomerase B